MDLYPSEHDGEAVEGLDMWAINNARACGAAPAETYARTGRWWHVEGGTLPAGSWPQPPAVDMADSEGRRQLRAYRDQADQEARQ